MPSIIAEAARTTLASRIREIAVSWGYWGHYVADDKQAMRYMRADIARALGCAPAAVLNTLKRSPKIGRPSRDTTHCSRCGQPLPVEHAKTRAVGAADARSE